MVVSVATAMIPFLENDDNSVALVANIPVNRMKHDAGKK